MYYEKAADKDGYLKFSRRFSEPHPQQCGRVFHFGWQSNPCQTAKSAQRHRLSLIFYIIAHFSHKIQMQISVQKRNFLFFLSDPGNKSGSYMSPCRSPHRLSHWKNLRPPPHLPHLMTYPAYTVTETPRTTSSFLPHLQW